MRAQRHRRLITSAKDRDSRRIGGGYSYSSSRERRTSPGRFIYRTNSSYQIRQPPMMSGRTGGYNKYSNVSNLFRNDEAGKLIHYFAPNMHGNCHYPNFNARPRSFYVT